MRGSLSVRWGLRARAAVAPEWRALTPPLLCAALWVLVPSAGFAQTIPPALDACSTQSDAGKRLACFDREIARLHQLQHDARAGAAAAQGAPSGDTAAAGSAGAPPASAPARAGSNTTGEQSALDNFGLTPELQHQRQVEANAPAPLREISAHVASVRYLPRGEIVVGLDNGQTWRQAEYDGDVSMAVGEPITIKAGALSAYYMKPRAGRIIRVRRLR